MKKLWNIIKDFFVLIFIALPLLILKYLKEFIKPKPAKQIKIGERIYYRNSSVRAGYSTGIVTAIIDKGVLIVEITENGKTGKRTVDIADILDE